MTAFVQLRTREVVLPENVRLRAVKTDDLPLLRRVYASTRDAELAKVDWTAEQKSAFVGSQFELQHRYYQAHFPRAEFYVVEYQSCDAVHDVGRLYFDRHDGDLRLIDVALLPEWRNRGIGTSILKGLLALSDQLRKEMVLHVEMNNPALSLYLRIGFETCDDNGVYCRMIRSPQQLAA